MKKFATAFLAGVAMTFALSAVAVAKDKTIAVSWKIFQEERWKTDEAAIKAVVEAAGDKYVSVDAQGSAAKQATDIEGLVSVGKLNLATGEVTDINIKVSIMNSALMALVSVNPKLPPTPIEFSTESRQDPANPHYGSAFAKFEQRADGTLDFTMAGVEFLPLGGGFGGDMLRFPLPFASADWQFASVPAVSTSLHPHINLSSKALEEPTADFLLAGRLPEIPVNTVREYTTFSHNTAFGDKFTLNVPEMEGGATGRSHWSAAWSSSSANGPACRS